MKSFEKFIALSGLPRTGSTLLTSILSQNPDIHAEGNSAVCQLMWDMQFVCENHCREQLKANDREKTKYDMVSIVPHVYYKNITSSIVVDKSRAWTLPNNVNLLKNYINDNIKIIVLERPLIEIVKSLVSLNIENGLKPSFDMLYNEEPILRSLRGIKSAKKNNNGEFIFITYDDLIQDAENTINNIYNFCDIPKFNHNYTKIVNIHPENDEAYGLLNVHTVRETISKRNLDVDLPNWVIEKCLELENS